MTTLEEKHNYLWIKRSLENKKIFVQLRLMSDYDQRIILGKKKIYLIKKIIVIIVWI